MSVLVLTGVRLHRAVQVVLLGHVAQALDLRLDRRVLDPEVVVQGLVHRPHDGRALLQRAHCGQGDVAGQEVQAVADLPDVQVMNVADGLHGLDPCD